MGKIKRITILVIVFVVLVMPISLREDSFAMKMAKLTPGNANITHNKLNQGEYSFALDSKGFPHVVWINGIPENMEEYLTVRYIRWDGENWVCIDGSPYVPGISEENDRSIVNNIEKNCIDPQIVIDADDNPHLTWAEPCKNLELETYTWNIIYVKGFGNQWVCMDGSIFDPDDMTTDNPSVVSVHNEIAFEPRLKIDNEGNPHILWKSYGDFDKEYTHFPVGLMYVKQKKSRWVTVNGEEYKSPNVVAGNPAVVCVGLYSSYWLDVDHHFCLDSKNRPHICWDNGLPQKECKDGYCYYTWVPDVFYSHWDGKDWVDAGGIKYDKSSTERGNVSKNDTPSCSPFVTLDEDDNAHLVWYDYVSEGRIVIAYAKWNGKKWVTTINTKFSGNNLFDGSPSVIDKTKYSKKPSLCIDSTNNPVVSWVGKNEEESYEDFYLIRWNGKKWEDINREIYEKNDLTSDPSNISRSYNIQLETNFCLDQSDNPHCLWLEGASSKSSSCYGIYGDLYYIRWDGENWVNASGDVYEPVVEE